MSMFMFNGSYVNDERNEREQQYWREIDLLNKQIKELQDWKTAAIAYMMKLDTQAIGKELGLQLGDDVIDAILPGIKKLKENQR